MESVTSFWLKCKLLKNNLKEKYVCSFTIIKICMISSNMEKKNCLCFTCFCLPKMLESLIIYYNHNYFPFI